MSEQISFNRDKGFVALPVGVLDMDLTPGAFRTLVELCRMANMEGYCWPSLTQLSDRLGRSKSAISGYLKELRGVGLVATEEQRTANGYNYRLKYQVTFWADWRASLSSSHAQKAERSIQPVERITKDKNQNHKNQTRVDELDDLLHKWSQCFGRAPYPQTEHAPDPRLVSETSKAIKLAEPKPISVDITPDLKTLFEGLGVHIDTPGLRLVQTHLSRLELSSEELQSVLCSIAKKWPAHWRKLPTEAQLQKLLKDTGARPRSKKRALLRSHLKRWRMAERSLRHPAASCSVRPAITPDQLAS